MGRTGSSSYCTIPPQSGGRSPRRVDPFVGTKTERPLGEVSVVVAVVVVVVVLVVVVVVVVVVVGAAAAFYIYRLFMFH